MYFGRVIRVDYDRHHELHGRFRTTTALAHVILVTHAIKQAALFLTMTKVMFFRIPNPALF